MFRFSPMHHVIWNSKTKKVRNLKMYQNSDVVNREINTGGVKCGQYGLKDVESYSVKELNYNKI